MGSRLWNPKQDCPGCVAWWDPNQGVTLSGSNVTQWTDVVGGIPAPVGNGQPLFSSTDRNGQPSINFTNNASLVFNVPSTFPVGNNPGVIALSGYLRSTTGPGRWAFSYGSGNSSTRYITSDSSPSGGGYTTAGIGGNGSNVFAAEKWLSQDRFIIATFGPNSNVAANVDGLAAESATTSSTINTNTGKGCIGKWPDYGDYFDGFICQIVIVNQALSDADRQKLEGWESWYTGKAGANLPSSHPYKNAAPTVSDGIRPRRRPLMLMAA